MLTIRVLRLQGSYLSGTCCGFECIPEFGHAVLLVVERQADDSVVGIVDVDGVRDSVLLDGEQEFFLPFVGFE